ncbi:hypothetical protein ACFL0V_04250 [Nanoarchaeota archaeon]
MELDLEDRKIPNAQFFTEKDMKKLSQFSELVQKLLKEKVASILLFKAETPTVLLMADDLNNVFMQNTTAEMKIKIAEACYKKNIEIDFKIMSCSEFWKHFKNRNPDIFKILRQSYLMYDIGFMSAIQELFVQGRIRPSKEARNTYYFKAAKNLKNSDRHLNTAVIDLYWAVVDCAHAAVMMADITPPSPKELAEVLRKRLCSRNLLHKRCADIMDEMYEISKELIHKKKWTVTGKDYDRYYKDAEFFIKETTEFVRHWQDKGK